MRHPSFSTPSASIQQKTLPVSLRPRLLAASLFAVIGATAQAQESAVAAQAASLSEMNLEDVMKIQVSSVSRKSQNMTEIAAAVYVIGQEDIRRSGATSIADILRLAPGLHVARDTANSLAISSRGFNARYANKLLVLIDGRTVYTPIFSGVFWDLQDTLIEDIERIEVIRGPGAAMWGANAVNGVINIITKQAKKTQGALIAAGAGNQERGFAQARYGGQIDDDTHYRAYAKGFDRAGSYWLDDRRAHDAWNARQAGFRVDKSISGGDKITLQGDAYRMNVDETVRSNTVLTPPWTSTYPATDHARGGNLLLRWESRQSATSETVFQSYLDSVHFAAPKLTSLVRTWDVDFQHRWRPDSTHDLMWGLNYRQIRFQAESSNEINFSAATQHKSNLGLFVQDDIALIQERLRLTLGAKLERNYFDSTQFQPNIRLLWTPASDHTLWAAASRAARTPSLGETSARIDFNMTPPGLATLGLPLATVIQGNPALKPEKLTAYEVGYRTRLNPRLTLDVTGFVNQYSQLITPQSTLPSLAFAPAPYLNLQLPYYNDPQSYRTRGVELVADWRPLNWMRLEATYTYLRMDKHPLGSGLAQVAVSTQSPQNQASLRWQMDIDRRTQLDFWLRRVGGFGNSGSPVAFYNALDARIGWKPNRNLDIALIGQNLLDRRHVEYSSSFAEVTQIPRSAHVKATWTFQ